MKFEKIWNKYTKGAIKIIFSAAALYWVFKEIDFKAVGEIFRTFNYFLLLPAIFFFILSQLLSARRLRRFFICSEIDISHKENFRLYMLGMFYNLFLPGGIGGDGYKMVLLNRKRGISLKNSFNAIFNDRLSGLVAVVQITAILFLFMDVDFPYHKYLWIAALLPVPGYYIFIRLFFKRFLRVIPRSVLYAFGVQLLQLCSVLSLIYGVSTDHISIGYCLLFLLSSLASLFPFTVGGIGAREMVFMYGATLFGLSEERAVTISLLFYLVSLVVSIYGVRYVFDKVLEEPEKSGETIHNNSEPNLLSDNTK